MSARAAIHAMFQLDEAGTAELDKRLDAHAIQVEARTLREAADLTEQRTGSPADQRLLLDFATQLRREANAREKATAPAATTAPDFFQAGHRYALDVWRFHCGTVTAHPETGEQSALGWLQISDGSLTTYAYSVDAWGEGWTDVTEAGGNRG